MISKIIKSFNIKNRFNSKYTIEYGISSIWFTNMYYFTNKHIFLLGSIVCMYKTIK